ncbi:MAG: hypothetical protein ABIW49_07180 [Knoellia sp.]
MTVQPSTLHFDLSAHSSELEYRLLCGVPGGVALRRYADEPSKLDEHRSTNAALALVQEDQLTQMTHFVEEAPLLVRGVAMHRVVFPSLDDHPLPEIAMAFMHVGGQDVEDALHRMPGYRDRGRHHLALANYGVEPEATFDNYHAVHLAATAVKPPHVTAQSIVMQHPEIGTVNGMVAQYVLDTYVSEGISFQDLVTYLQENGPNTDSCWYNKSWVSWSQNPDGTGPLVPAEANTELVYKNGEKITTWHTPPGATAPGLATYDLTDEYDPPAGNSSDHGVIGAATAVVSDVLRATKDDSALRGLMWTQQTGTTERTATAPATPGPSPVATSAPMPAPAPAPQLRPDLRGGRPGPLTAIAPAVAAATSAGALTSSASAFGVKNVTSTYGLWLYDTELTWDDDKKMLTIPVKNWPARYLGLYVSFLRSDGTAISRAKITATNPKDPSKPFTWEDRLPLEMVRSFVEPSDTKNYLGFSSAGSALFGAPTPFLTQRTELSFLWPDDATHAAILLGGLGCASGFSDWDSDVDIVGVLATGIVCYGIGAIAMLAQVYIINPFIAWLQEEWGVGFFAVAGCLGAAGIVTGAGTFDSSFGKMVLSKLAGIATGVVFGKIMERLIVMGAKAAIKGLTEATAEFVAEMTAEEALEQVPVAGWALKVVSIAASLASLTATTVECVLSPATYQLDVLRTMDLEVTVSPDPTHGTKNQKPVWPLVSDHYVVRVTYPAAPGQSGGTTYTLAGPMPAAHDESIVVTFTHIPAGGKVEVTAGLYSDTNWLCGLWSSGWVSAVPTSGDSISVAGAIKEVLVPLTPTTTYSQKQALTYAGGTHLWRVTRFSLPSALASGLDAGGSPPADLVAAFAAQGNPLAATAKISVVTPHTSWIISDSTTGAAFSLALVPIPDSTDSEIKVVDTQHEVPPLPTVYPLPKGPTGHQLGFLQNIVHNNTSYQLGYAWMASGQSLPLDHGDQPQNVPMYAMQSISTLARPEDLIFEPTRGFSLPTLIAYDQFGLTELFPLPAAMAGELVAGPVPADVAHEFAGFGRTLPAGSQVAVVTAGSAWTIGVAGQSPLYELDLVTVTDASAAAKDPKTSATTSHIAVYAYPVPGLDNFYLDPRSHTAANPVFYLRGVDLDQGLGKHTFDYDGATAWGRFMNTGNLQGLTVHPQGYVVGVDYVNHKLYSLKLPAAAMPSDDAPCGMPLAGEGVREGLMQNPQALTITADGRILVLEEGNRRIQAFDVMGNPVACFSVGQPHFLIGTQFVKDLDAHEAPPALVQAFQAGAKPASAPKFAVKDPGPVVAHLDTGVVDATLIDALTRAGFGSTGNQPDAYSVFTTTAGHLWLLTDTTSGLVLDLRLESDEYGVPYLDAYTAPTLMVTLQSAGASWLVEDTTNFTRHHVTKPPTGDLVAQQVVSYLPLREAASTGVTYLDVATESKGYIYVLLVKQESGAPTFYLDIYSPDGSVLLTEPQSGVNAERLTVDQWRSMFTLGFDVVSGPDGRTEPGISEWMPSTPTTAGH